MTITTPEAIEALCDRLTLMADQGDFGRGPDPNDFRRVTVSILRTLSAENARLREALDIRTAARTALQENK
jgi:hypothetical protein